MAEDNKKIKVLVVEDDKVIQKLLKKVFSKGENFELVGVASDPFIARDMLINSSPDLMILDIHLPKMNGIEFLNKVMRFYPTKTVIFTSSKDPKMVLEAITAGALDFIEKPKISNVDDLSTFSKKFLVQLDQLSKSKNLVFQESRSIVFDKKELQLKNNLILIGSSTGGIEVLARIFKDLPTEFPPVVVVQHIQSNYVQSLCEHLSEVCRRKVQVSRQGLKIEPNTIYIATGGLHSKLMENQKGNLCFSLSSDCEPVNNVIPSIDVLYESASLLQVNKVALLLTGMGRDGAAGLLQLKQVGAWTICQSEKSCTVYGMPKEAVSLEAQCEILDPEQMISHLFKRLR